MSGRFFLKHGVVIAFIQSKSPWQWWSIHAYHNSKTATVRLTGDCHLARWRKLTLLTLSDVKISIFLKSKMADGRNYENRKIRHYMALCQGPASERGKDPNVSERQDR